MAISVAVNGGDVAPAASNFESRVIKWSRSRLGCRLTMDEYLTVTVLQEKRPVWHNYSFPFTHCR